MARPRKPGFSDPVTCHTPKASGGGFFHPILPPEESIDNKLVRPGMLVESVTGTAATWVPAFQVSLSIERKRS